MPRAHPEPRSLFRLTVEGRPGLAGIRGLRWFVKRLARGYGLRVVDLREAGNRSGNAALKSRGRR
jgi:hypothetical protein